MMINKIRASIAKRIQTDDEWEDAVNKCLQEETAILTEDIQKTISFLENECTADEFSWLSEVFILVVEKNKSREFIDCLYRVAQKFPEECATYNIMSFMSYISNSKEFSEIIEVSR